MVNEKKKNAILTIAIPTYNRVEQIQKQVRSLLPQLTDEVQLIVYDNHSDIPVKAWFSDEELKQFMIVRNSVNVGGDANIARCFEYCKTKWLWTLSDDDYAKENAVEVVLSYIRDNEDATFINFWSPIEKVTNNVADFLQILSHGGVFSSAFTMSVCVYNMNILKNDLYYFYKNLSSMVGPLIMLIRNVLKVGGECVWVNRPQVELGADVSWNYRDFINRSLLFILEFRDTREPKFYKNIFLGLYGTDYGLISMNRASSNVSWIGRLMLLGKVSINQGIFNALRYSSKDYLKCILSLFMGNKLKETIKTLISHR